jgi:uncharacterized membrane-anchored protein YhcB (DUF1043 family)
VNVASWIAYIIAPFVCAFVGAFVTGYLVQIGEKAAKKRFDVTETLLREKTYLLETQVAWARKHNEGLLAMLREISNKWETAYTKLSRKCDAVSIKLSEAHSLLAQMAAEDEEGFIDEDTVTVCISWQTYEKAVSLIQNMKEDTA